MPEREREANGSALSPNAVDDARSDALGRRRAKAHQALQGAPQGLEGAAALRAPVAVQLVRLRACVWRLALVGLLHRSVRERRRLRADPAPLLAAQGLVETDPVQPRE